MTRDQLLDALCTATSGEFDLVLAKLAVPAAYLSSSQAAQATRAAELLRWVEQHERIADLEQALRPAATIGSRSSGQRPRSAIAALGLVALASVGCWRWNSLRHAPSGPPLIWAGSDCEHKEPRIGYGSCNETRELPWLQSQINGLRSARVLGFEDLQLDPKLESVATSQGGNWLLNLYSNGDRFSVGVGYSAEMRAKDGCLHLYNPRRPSFHASSACLDEQGHWWTSDGWLGTYRRIELDSAGQFSRLWH